jgi:hypothetical protein
MCNAGAVAVQRNIWLKPFSGWRDAHISNSAVDMYSHDIIYKCGHTVPLVSVRDDDHAQQLVQQDCPDCQRASLPPLKGSPRQVAWAEKIRAQAMDAWLNDKPWLDRRPEQMTSEAVASTVAKHGNVALLRQTVEIILVCHARLHIERSAKWWIEHGRDATNFAQSQLRWAEAVAAHLPPIVGVNV